MKIKVLDGLRRYAVLMVMLFPLVQLVGSIMGTSIYSLITIRDLGYLGVGLFFILSSFLIIRIFLFGYYKSTNEG